jgi:Leu/Phe-tRNA-protein transferase
MADNKTGHINWYMPESRCIIPLDKFNIPKSTKKTQDRKRILNKI